jgi:hypothetical protein
VSHCAVKHIGCDGGERTYKFNDGGGLRLLNAALLWRWPVGFSGHSDSRASLSRLIGDSTVRAILWGVWFAKTLADCEINDITPFCHCFLMTPSHVSIHRPGSQNAGSPLARPSEPLTRGLDLLNKLFWVSIHRFWRDGNNPSLRSRPKPWCVGTGADSVCTEADLQGPEARRETTDVERGSGIDLADGR